MIGIVVSIETNDVKIPKPVNAASFGTDNDVWTDRRLD